VRSRRYRIPSGNVGCCIALYDRSRGLFDEFRMDKSHLAVATTSTPSDAKASWQTRTMPYRQINQVRIETLL
jgi:hypothetical protein